MSALQRVNFPWKSLPAWLPEKPMLLAGSMIQEPVTLVSVPPAIAPAVYRCSFGFTPGSLLVELAFEDDRHVVAEEGLRADHAPVGALDRAVGREAHHALAHERVLFHRADHAAGQRHRFGHAEEGEVAGYFQRLAGLHDLGALEGDRAELVGVEELVAARDLFLEGLVRRVLVAGLEVTRVVGAHRGRVDVDRNR